MIDDFWLEIYDELWEKWDMKPTFDEVSQEIERRFKMTEEEQMELSFRRIYGKQD